MGRPAVSFYYSLYIYPAVFYSLPTRKITAAQCFYNCDHFWNDRLGNHEFNCCTAEQYAQAGFRATAYYKTHADINMHDRPAVINYI